MNWMGLMVSKGPDRAFFLALLGSRAGPDPTLFKKERVGLGLRKNYSGPGLALGASRVGLGPAL